MISHTNSLTQAELRLLGSRSLTCHVDNTFARQHYSMHCSGRSLKYERAESRFQGRVEVSEGQPPDCISPFSSCYRVVLHRWPSMAASGPQEIKLFGKWSYDDVEVISKATRLTAGQAVERKCKLANLVAFLGERHLIGRLHCRQVKECSLCTSHSWTVSKEEVQESTMPNC